MTSTKKDKNSDTPPTNPQPSSFGLTTLFSLDVCSWLRYNPYFGIFLKKP